MPTAARLDGVTTLSDLIPQTSADELKRSWLSARAFALIQVAAKGAGFASVLLAVLAARPVEYGLFTAGVLAAAAITVFADFGSSSVIGRLAALGATGDSFVAYLSSRLLALYGAGLLALVAGVVAHGDIAAWILVIALGLTMGGNAVAGAALLGLARGGHSGASNLCFNIVALAGVGLLVVAERGSAAASHLLLTNVAGATAAAIWSVAILARDRVFVLPSHGNFIWRSPDAQLSWRTGIAQVVIFANTYVDQAVMYLFLGPAALAYYGLGAKFRDAANAVPAIVSTGFQAHFVVGIHGRSPGAFYRQTICRMVVLCSALGSVVAATAPYAIQHWLPQSYGQAAPLVPIFAAGVFGGALHIVALFAVRGLAGERLSSARTTLTYLLPAILTAGATILAADVGGIVTVATVKSAADIVGFAGVIIFVSRRVGLPGASVVPLAAAAIPGVLIAATNAHWLLAAAAIALPAALAVFMYPREPKIA